MPPVRSTVVGLPSSVRRNKAVHESGVHRHGFGRRSPQNDRSSGMGDGWPQVIQRREPVVRSRRRRTVVQNRSGSQVASAASTRLRSGWRRSTGSPSTGLRSGRLAGVADPKNLVLAVGDALSIAASPASMCGKAVSGCALGDQVVVHPASAATHEMAQGVGAQPRPGGSPRLPGYGADGRGRRDGCRIAWVAVAAVLLHATPGYLQTPASMGRRGRLGRAERVLLQGTGNTVQVRRHRTGRGVRPVMAPGQGDVLVLVPPHGASIFRLGQHTAAGQSGRLLMRALISPSAVRISSLAQPSNRCVVAMLSKWENCAGSGQPVPPRPASPILINRRGVMPTLEAASHIVEPTKKVNGGRADHVVDVSTAGRQTSPLTLRDPVAPLALLTRSSTCRQVDSGLSPGPGLGDIRPDP